ncbi:dihydroorotate dehydrogenase electron transfer subunit [Patescibacteria group bacterium]|nr:dihydroorotate dehydrogenase electron transfer subunit [Patescibacteria group bacterium]
MNTQSQSRLPTTHRIVDIKQETDHVQTFTFNTSLGAKPGQFAMVWLPGVDEVPMSIAYDDGKQIRITFFAVGDMTKKLAKSAVGDLVGLRGAFGSNYEWEKGQKLALLAGGYGAAPMYFAAHEAIKDGCDVHVFVGARSKEHLLYLDELSSLKNVTLHVATDDGSQGFKGFNVQDINKVIKGGEKFDQLFACGPERMLVAVSQLSCDHQVPSQLSLERYMKCGYGLCGNCVVDPLGIRLCIDGPVVHNDVCVKITEFGKYHRDGVGRKIAF